MFTVSSNEEAQPYLSVVGDSSVASGPGNHRRPMIDALAMALMEHGTITGRAAFELILKAAKPTRQRCERPRLASDGQ